MKDKRAILFRRRLRVHMWKLSRELDFPMHALLVIDNYGRNTGLFDSAIGLLKTKTFKSQTRKQLARDLRVWAITINGHNYKSKQIDSYLHHRLETSFIKGGFTTRIQQYPRHRAIVDVRFVN